MAESTPQDVPELEKLTLLNYGTEPDLVNAGVANAMAALPEWEPRAGNTEMVLMESLAVMLGPEVLAVQMLPGVIVEQFMKLFGVARGDGSPVRGRVEFTITNSQPTQVIPAGTRLRLSLDGTGETVDLFTDERLEIIITDSMTGRVNVTAETFGVAGNFAPAGTSLDVVDQLPFVESATIVTAFSGGSGPENESTFTGRASATLARLTSTLVLPESFQYAAAATPGIGRAKVYDRYNPATPAVPVVTGHVTVAVAGADGNALDAQTMADLEDALAAQALASLSIHVIAPTYTDVSIAVTVKPSYGFTAAQVQASVTAALQDWISPATWDWGAVVRQYEIIAKVYAAPGVGEVTLAPANIALAGKAPLPRLTGVTVTVA